MATTSSGKPTITEWLQGLGDTPEAVAASLAALGVKGRRGITDACPVVVGIRRCCDLPWGVPYAVGVPYGGYRLTYLDVQINDPRLPQAVAAFMGDFDHGAFPEVAA